MSWPGARWITRWAPGWSGRRCGESMARSCRLPSTPWPRSRKRSACAGAETSAFGIDPLVAVAVDVTHATDHPNINKKTAGDVTLGGGPTISRGPNFNPVVVEKLIEAAEALDMPVQMEAAGRGTGTDANAIQLTRARGCHGAGQRPVALHAHTLRGRRARRRRRGRHLVGRVRESTLTGRRLHAVETVDTSESRQLGGIGIRSQAAGVRTMCAGTSLIARSAPKRIGREQKHLSIAGHVRQGR